ncbi:MAG: hypothetical protein PHF51_03910 [Candidatus ainarchaeum sp.]|nr:hypothetical protein [Candidatus ainarchaeum sp.]
MAVAGKHYGVKPGHETGKEVHSRAINPERKGEAGAYQRGQAAGGSIGTEVELLDIKKPGARKAVPNREPIIVAGDAGPNLLVRDAKRFQKTEKGLPGR